MIAQFGDRECKEVDTMALATGSRHAVGQRCCRRIAVGRLSKKFILPHATPDPTVSRGNVAWHDHWFAWRVGCVPFSPISLA
jgi:hypothetical protein